MASLAEQEGLWRAVSEALEDVMPSPIEDELGLPRLEKRLRGYFRKGAKNLDFTKRTWQQLINDYADTVFCSIFVGLGDREWLGQVDFLLALDAGIKDGFPARFLQGATRDEFERTVLAAHDRAFEEQRYYAILWKVLSCRVFQERARKKVQKAADFGRAAAVQTTALDGRATQVKEYVSRWIDATLFQLGQLTRGCLDEALEEPEAKQLFHALIEEGALPIPITANHGPPPPRWPFIDYSVHQAYVAHSWGHDGRPLRALAGSGYGAWKGARRGRQRRYGPYESVAHGGSGAGQHLALPGFADRPDLVDRGTDTDGLLGLGPGTPTLALAAPGDVAEAPMSGAAWLEEAPAPSLRPDVSVVEGSGGSAAVEAAASMLVSRVVDLRLGPAPASPLASHGEPIENAAASEGDQHRDPGASSDGGRPPASWLGEDQVRVRPSPFPHDSDDECAVIEVSPDHMDQ